MARSEAAVIVVVRRGRGKAPEELTLLRVVGGDEAKVKAEVNGRVKGEEPTVSARLPPDWLNMCVPSRAELKRWVFRHKSWQARPLWEKARVAPRFESLLFLQTINGKLRPSCELESMLMKQTSLHPHYPAYVDEVKAAWARRRP